jgi:hypothetical protein
MLTTICKSTAIQATQTQHPNAVRSFFNYFSTCFGRSFDCHQVEGGKVCYRRGLF